MCDYYCKGVCKIPFDQMYIFNYTSKPPELMKQQRRHFEPTKIRRINNGLSIFTAFLMILIYIEHLLAVFITWQVAYSPK
jgi:hypothetical protein